ncbi:MAG: glucosamine-6-phosphate isomerase [Anaerolineae bacterium]|jgi:glucosamine-6-phosphate deaminase|nr:glucosamine-6-phosphate isomerase [Chloroflexota bacterium]
MPRFEPIIRNVTLSREDMAKLLAMPLDEMQDWSPVNVQVLDPWRAVMEAKAKIMVDCIRANNAAGRITTLILPVGPTEQYPIAAEMSNREGISWKNVWTFNMDEYLDWEGRPIPVDHPMSFHGAMQRDLFDRLDPALAIPEEQRWFPDPFNPDAIDNKIDELTGGEGVDICFGGIGEHGHIAFNEAPTLMTHYAHLTPEEFKNSKTRVLPLNPETLIRALRHPSYQLCPPSCVTLGMRVLLGAKRIVLSTTGVIAKIAAMHPPTMDFPVTYIQEHANPKETVTLLVGRNR